MKKPAPSVIVVLNGFKSLGGMRLAREFFDALLSLGREYAPRRVGMAEPMRTPFSVESATDVWVDSEKKMGFGSVMFKGRTYEQLHGDIEWREGSNQISLSIAVDSLRATQHGTVRLKEFVKKMFLWANCVYGYGAHSSQRPYTRGLSFETCLPTITWMTLLGIPYVRMFTKDLIASAPCQVEEFAESNFMLLTTQEPAEENPELLDIQERVKMHLGADAFCRQEATKGVLSAADLVEGKDRPSKAGYRSPDLSDYARTSSSSQSGLIAFVDDKGRISTKQSKTNRS